MRSLSYCRIIDYIKYFELTQCFSSRHLLVFCYKRQVLLVSLQTENLGKKGEYVIKLGFPSNVTERLGSSRVDTLFFNVLKRMQETFYCISFGWKDLPRRSWCYRFWVQKETAHSLQLDTAPATFISQKSSPLFIQSYIVILMIEVRCYKREDFTCLP